MRPFATKAGCPVLRTTAPSSRRDHASPSAQNVLLDELCALHPVMQPEAQSEARVIAPFRADAPDERTDDHCNTSAANAALMTNTIAMVLLCSLPPDTAVGIGAHEAPGRF